MVLSPARPLRSSIDSPKAAHLVTLLTDFGLQDTYVGVMKGVMLAIDPRLSFVDLTHGVPPQQVTSGSFHLAEVHGYFPIGTVHLAVVDPGVGTMRRAIAVATERGWLVGPDNGLLSGVLAQWPPRMAVELVNPNYWRTPEPSQTFHGRDIFAPVAAHLARGVPLVALGNPIDPQSLTMLPHHRLLQHKLPHQQPGAPVPSATPEDGSPTSALAPVEDAEFPSLWVRQGLIQHIDRFGNLITTIPASALPDRPWVVQLEHLQVPAVQTYDQGVPGQLLALVGSQGWVEVAIRGGSAHQVLGARVGQVVQVREPIA
ncbi:MAG: SAM hydrolase/SAM-dependent halogenase family protein [Prochlorothrix sp.]|nr:SAM-dependent chlorinase/fluorinase [Prochlorothrix sp.]